MTFEFVEVIEKLRSGTLVACVELETLRDGVSKYEFVAEVSDGTPSSWMVRETELGEKSFRPFLAGSSDGEFVL